MYRVYYHEVDDTWQKHKDFETIDEAAPWAMKNCFEIEEVRESQAESKEEPLIEPE